MAQLAGRGRDYYQAHGPDENLKDSTLTVYHLKAQGNLTGEGAVLALDSVGASGAITTVYLWVSTDGKLRIGTTLPTNTEAGTIVGTQA